MTTETTTALTAPEPAQPPDLKRARQPKKSLDEALLAVKRMNMSPSTIEEHEQRKIYGRYAAQDIDAVATTIGMQTVGVLDSMIKVMSEGARDKKKNTIEQREKCAGRVGELSEIRIETMDRIVKWSREIPAANPPPPPRLNGAPTLNVNINTKHREDDDDETDSIEVNTLAKDAPAV